MSQTVAITSVTFEGATAFPPARLASLVGNLSGPAVELRRVEAARIAILGLYRDEGYAFTTVDAVLAPGGALRLVIGEAQITEVRLDGDIGPAGTQVLRFLNNLVGLRPLEVRTLERWLLLADDIPGVTVRTVLRPAGTGPGALSLVAQVSREPITGYVTADNRGFKRTGPQQGLAAVQFNSFSEFGEVTELSLFYASGATQVFGQASSEFFVGGSGARVRLYAGTGRSTPSAPLRDIGYEGISTIAGVSVAYPLIRRRQQRLSLVGAFDLIDNEVRLDPELIVNRTLSRDQVRVLRIGLDWALFDALLGDDLQAVNTVSLRLSQGLDAFGATPTGSAELSRLGAQTDFTKFSFELGRTQVLPPPWPGATLALQGILAGQVTSDILPQTEKFYLGGARLGRGYYAGQVTGDSALAGSLELQLGVPWETSVFGRSVPVNPLLYAFTDLGRAWQNQSDETDGQVASIGAGVRFNLAPGAEFLVEGVRRLQLNPNDSQSQNGRVDAYGGYWRLLFRL